jgi:hypothetical protein
MYPYPYNSPAPQTLHLPKFLPELLKSRFVLLDFTVKRDILLA